MKLYYGYCLGWIIYNDTNYSGHDGDLPGGHARMKWNKSNNLGIIYFWNSDEKPSDGPKRVELIANLEEELLKNVVNV